MFTLQTTRIMVSIKTPSTYFFLAFALESNLNQFENVRISSKSCNVRSQIFSRNLNWLVDTNRHRVVYCSGIPVESDPKLKIFYKRH